MLRICPHVFYCYDMYMTKILLVSDDNEKVNRYEGLLKNSYEFFFSNEETMIYDTLKVDAPEVIICDVDTISLDLKFLIKKVNSYRENIIKILIAKDDNISQDLLRNADAVLLEPVSEVILHATINSNLRNKKSLEMLSNNYQELAQSLYQLNVLYNTSSQFSSTLDKDKLVDIMTESMTMALGVSFCCALYFSSENQPVLAIKSQYKISDRLLESLKLRYVLRYKSLFEGKKVPFELNIDNLVCEKIIKNDDDEFDFSIFQYDNMFSVISLSDKFFGFVEIYRGNEFTNEDMKCFQTIAQQVSSPLRNAYLYQEIQQTNKKLEKSERVKSEFISIVSHELRTPLAVIKGNIDSIKRFFTLPEKMIPLVDKVISNITRLSGIINDLLDLSKIEAGKMEYKFQIARIDSVVEYVKTSMSGLAASKNIELSLELEDNEALIFADTKRLEQVLTNLVQNAIKFTPDGKNITIKSFLKDASQISDVHFADDLKNLEGKYLVLCVSDEGIGIHEDDLKHVFDKFEQIENSLTRQVGGTGLGLSITKQFVEAHNGVIWCDSVPDKGSNFYVAIPVKSDKNIFWVSHKQMVNSAKVHNNTVATIEIKAPLEVLENLKQEELFVRNNYLNNSLLEKGEDLAVLTFGILGGDRNLAKLIKQKIDDIMVNNPACYPKCAIMYSYTIYPEGNS